MGWGSQSIIAHFVHLFVLITGVHSIAGYKEIAEKIERLSKLFSYAMLITLGFLTPPALGLTIINYFIYDLQEESFYLLYPIL